MTNEHRLPTEQMGIDERLQPAARDSAVGILGEDQPLHLLAVEDISLARPKLTPASTVVPSLRRRDFLSAERQDYSRSCDTLCDRQRQFSPREEYVAGHRPQDEKLALTMLDLWE